LVQLGHALSGLPPLELALYQTPKLNYRIVARAVRKTKSPPEIRATLRDALGKPTGPKLNRTRRHAQLHDREIRTLGQSFWDDREATANPVAAVADFATRLEQLHQRATAGLEGAIARRRKPLPLAGQSLSALASSIREYRRRHSGVIESLPLSPSEQLAMEQLARLGEAIKGIKQSLIAKY
jgi:hypothetical protein